MSKVDIAVFIYYATAVLLLLSIILMMCFYWWKGWLFLYALKHGNKGNDFPEAKKNHRFTILIPARDESNVIRGLFDSIKNQNYDLSLLSVIVGVESLDDPTCKIAEEYGFHIYLKKNLELKGKGYIVKEMIDYSKTLKFQTEAYIIFDADNIIHPDYVYEMNKAYDAGNEVAVGYRNTKNWNSSWVSACSGLTFLRFSTLENLGRARYNATVQLSGTGFYISKKELERLGGWNFYTMTEDLELTVIMAIKNTKCTYVSKAIFYDEQPIKFKESFNQRLRWVRGYQQVSSKYKKELKDGVNKTDGSTNRLGCFDFAYQALPFSLFMTTCVLTILLVITASILSSIDTNLIYPKLWIAYSGPLAVILTLIQIYIFIVFDTIVATSIDKKHIKINKRTYTKMVLLNPIFIFWYVIIGIKNMTTKKIEWTKIEHSVDMSYDDIVKDNEENNHDNDNKE